MIKKIILNDSREGGFLEIRYDEETEELEVRAWDQLIIRPNASNKVTIKAEKLK